MTTFALSKLFDDVGALFIADGSPDCAMVFGWRKPPKQLNQGPRRANRVVFVPGDPSGAVGELGAARNPGRNPRPLATLPELFTIYVWACDTTAPSDEHAQYQATRELYDAVVRAMYKTARGTFAVKSQRWVGVAEGVERRFGAEIELVCTIEAMIPDKPWRAVEDASGAVTVEAGLPSGDVNPNPGPVGS